MADKQVFWCVLRPVMDEALNAVLAVAGFCARQGYGRIATGRERTDTQRNNIALAFMRVAREDSDTLVMLDGDHNHPADIVQRLVSHHVPVVAALSFRRGEPYDVVSFVRGPDRQLCNVNLNGHDGLVPVIVAGTGAIAIQRGVFRRLHESGLHWPWFRYLYNELGQTQSSEDVTFGLLCEQAGIPQFVDVGCETPHLGTHWIDRNVHERFSALSRHTHGGGLKLEVTQWPDTLAVDGGCLASRPET